MILEKVDDDASFICTVSSSNGPERQCVIGPFHVTSRRQNDTAVDSQQDQGHDYPNWLLATSAIVTGLFVLALIAIFCLIIRIRKLGQYIADTLNTGRTNPQQRSVPPSHPPPKRPSEPHHYADVPELQAQTDSGVVAGLKHRQRRSDPNTYVGMENAQQILKPVAEENGPNDAETRDLASDPNAVGHRIPRQQRQSSGTYEEMAHSIRDISKANGALGAWLQEHERENVQSIVINNRFISIKVRRKSSAARPPFDDTYDVNTRRMSQTL